MINRIIQTFLFLTIIMLLFGGFLIIKKMQKICNEEKERIKRECNAELFEERYKQIMKGINYEDVNIVEHNNSIKFNF